MVAELFIIIKEKTMINFFRKKRKKMADDNKALKYTRYAIGEIVLVVIGIVIALQINNWNEQRKNANQELKLLKSFKTGLEKDLSDIDFNISIHTRGINSANKILKLLENDQPYNDSIAIDFIFVMTPTFFVNSTSAFETLKSKGIDLIKNETLRVELINVYDAQYTFFLKVESQFSEEQNLGLRNIFPSRFEESYKFDLESSDLSGELIPLDFESLKTDQEFLYFLKSINNRANIFVNYSYKRLRTNVVKLITAVDKEINKIENSQ
jgi:hypothetical protein